MLGTTTTATTTSSSGDGPEPNIGGVGPSSGGLSEEDKIMKFEDIERGSGGGGGNRWPRQETLALLKIRSDMDAAFKDSSLKGPLWDEVSRKLAELGYRRNPKKCKEKFENVYKYHRRTKEGRSTKSEGKTYRFFEQLEALDQNQPNSSHFSPPPPQPPQQYRPQNQGPESPTPVAMAMPTNIIHNHQIFPQVTVTSTNIVPQNQNMLSQSLNTSIALPPLSNPPPPPVQAPTVTTIPTNNTNSTPNPFSNKNLNTEFEYFSEPSSSSTDEEDPERRQKRKRKWESFFQKLMNEVIEKQENMQKQFLETLEKRERDRVAREEAWRVQEIARMNREHELLAQERSVAAAKDSAVIAYLQKVSDQNQQIPNITSPIQTQITKVQAPIHAKENSNPNPNPVTQVPLPSAQPPAPPLLQVQQPPQQQQRPSQLPQQPPPQTQLQLYDNSRNGNYGGENYNLPPSSSRWPKAEVQALIQLRTNMDIKYQENGPKGPLWEEISSEMKKIGFNRNAKRCKEKWENINKYFKKVKESNKKRPEDSKTCPYFHLLEAIYKAKSNNNNESNMTTINTNAVTTKSLAAAIMAQPEQQWPQTGPATTAADHDRESEEELDEIDDDDEDEDEDEDEAGGYEIVTNKLPLPTSSPALGNHEVRG